MAAYEKAHIDEIASQRWPHWIPIRHHFAIQTFGMNAYRGNTGANVLPEHDESDSGDPELYYVASGHATFSVAGEEIDAPAGTCVWLTDADARRSAVAQSDETLVLAIAAGRPGEAFRPDGWDSEYLEGDG